MTWLTWKTPLYVVSEGRIRKCTLKDFELHAMLPRERGVDFRYFVDEDSDGLYWVMKVPVQGARPIRISFHSDKKEAQRCADSYNIGMAYEKAIEEGAFESEWDAQEFLNECGE